MASTPWPLWLSVEGASSSPTDFLHLSRTNIKRIRVLIRLRKPLNPLQCSIMSSKLRKTIDNIKGLSPLLDDVNLFNGSVALENFYRVSEKARRLVENCCRADWCQASAFQIQNEEAFREILLETSLSYNSIRQLSEEIHKGVLLWDFCDTSTFDPPSVEEVFKDRVALQDRLKGLVNAANKSSSSILPQQLGKSVLGLVNVANKCSSNIRPQHLAQYLLRRVNFTLQDSPPEDLDVMSFNLWSDGKGPNAEWSKESEYLGGSVCKTTWLGIPCTKKLFEGTLQEDLWLREAEILASLNHPNIVKFLCCNKYENIHTKGHFIAMELMETSLFSFIRRLKEGGLQLPLFSAIDIMLQIGYGMCFLHDNGVAHRDLKTSNVVVSRIDAPHLQNYLEVKIIDFSLAKVKLSQDKSNTITHPKIGTTNYRAPEAFSNGRANWFKADVYSFSVMCSVILSGEEPFLGIKRGDLCAAIRSGQRPNLPVDTPKELVSVISEGWAMDRDLRPSFLGICTRLEKLRHRLLRGHYLHSLGLRLKGKDQYGVEHLGVKYPDDLYIKELMEKRSEVRQLDPSHSRLQVAMNFTEEEWFHGDEVEEQPRSVQSQQQLLRGRVFQEEISIGIGVTEDGGGGIDGSSSSGGLQVSSCGKIGGGVDSPQDVGIALNLSSTSPPRPIPSNRETVESLNTSPPLNTSPVVSQGSGIGPPMDYFKEASSSIKLIQELASGQQVQLHLRQCRYLSSKLSETGGFLKAKAEFLRDIPFSDDIRRTALRQLHFTVKRVEKLLRSCCCELDPSWLDSAVTLVQIKEEIVDILLDLRWWTSMVDIAIATVTLLSSGEIIELELLKLAEKDFENLLLHLQSPSNELDEAVAKDKEQVLTRVRKLQKSYAGKPRDREYLLASHVRARLENLDLVQSMADVELNAFEYVGMIGMGSFGTVMNVKWLGRSCALKMLKDECTKEASTLNAIHHPHIVQFIRYWEAPFCAKPGETKTLGTSRGSGTKRNKSSLNGVLSNASSMKSHILMELLPTDLAEHIQSLAANGMSQDVAIDLMMQVAKAMWHLNNYNVAHRDLSPSNVLLRPVSAEAVPELAARGYVRVKLGDFGLVKTAAMSIANSSGTKMVGTKKYGAPEVFIEDSVIPKESPRFPRLADVWSFGIMFSEVLSGQPPFLAEQQKHGMGELHARIQKGLRPQLPASCPDYLKFCITNCWQLRPQDRPNFADLWKLLRFAQVRSLGLFREDHELFTFTTREGVVKRLQKRPDKDPKSICSLCLHFWRISFPFARKRDPSTEAIQNSNRKQSRAGSSETRSEGKPLGYFVNPVDTQDATSGSTEVDVIFFEGNVGRRKYLSCTDTWVQRGKPDVCWPRDWLANDFEGDIRVLLLEYCISENGIEGVVEELQKFLVFSDRWNRGHTWNRPIVLVGHSLGCVVIEQLVVALNQRAESFGSLNDFEANRANVSKAFLASLAGCFFYAPPYTGLVPSEDLLKYVFGGLTYSPILFNDLCLTSPKLKELSERFMEARSEGVKLMAFIEGFRTRGRTVVLPASMDDFKASGGRVEELHDSNHSDTCKPINKKHPAYRFLFEFIQEILNERKWSKKLA